jgi:hypothetical protein
MIRWFRWVLDVFWVVLGGFWWRSRWVLYLQQVEGDDDYVVLGEGEGVALLGCV